eukprot:4612918-Amphidinium_carterae.1
MSRLTCPSRALSPWHVGQLLYWQYLGQAIGTVVSGAQSMTLLKPTRDTCTMVRKSFYSFCYLAGFGILMIWVVTLQQSAIGLSFVCGLLLLAAAGLRCAF